MASHDDDFVAAARSIADERYGGKFARGFAHLSLQLTFPTLELTDVQAEDIIEIDRPGDLGIDGVHIDSEERRIYLFQAKSSATLAEPDLHKEIAAFLDSAAKLLSDEWVDAKAHAEMKALANEFREAVSNGADLVFGFATESRATTAVRSTFDDLSHAPATAIPAVMVLLGGTELRDHYEKLLLAQHKAHTTVQFAASVAQMHEPPSVERVLYLTIPAAEYVAACKRYGMELFRYNPRLYLGANRVNSGIAETLKDKGLRVNFHLLNNGITAVCERFDIADAGDGRRVVNVDDFQVVNGCQTTMTLFNHSAEIAGDEKCLVDIKIIEARGLRDLVSRSTNTQTSILAEDAFSNAPEQKQIHDAMRRHSPPYFYGHKRGDWDRVRAGERRVFLDEKSPWRRYRRLTSKELAAVALAVFGEPEAAKDKPRLVFEKPAGKQSAFYDRIFNSTFAAAQWLLPVELLRHANILVKTATDEARRSCGDDPDCPAAVRARIGAYGRFRMIHLAYAYLKSITGSTADFVDALRSERLLETMENWAPNLLRLSFNAVADAYDDAKEDGDSSGLREFFREKKHQKLVQVRFNRELERSERSASLESISLAGWLRIPSAS